MNELIEQLRRQLNKGETTFGDAIQTACKAQRNACIRRIRDEYMKSDHVDLISTTLTAEIERQDYE